MTKSRDIANSTSTLDVDGGTIKLDGNYPVGTNNVALGDSAFAGSLSGDSNVALGYQSHYSLTSGNANTSVGRGSGFSTTTGGNNVAVGYTALASNTTASFNTAVGHQAGYSNTTGADNTFIGNYANYYNTTGSNITAVGKQALNSNTASNNTAVGYQAGYSNTTGADNFFSGYFSGYANTTASNNIGVGSSSLRFNTTGANNVAVGTTALFSNTTASNNVAVGYQAGYSNNTGVNNTVIGRDAGYNNQTADGNVFIGEYAGRSTTNSNNTFLGTSSGWQVTSGQKNTILGRYNGNQGGLDIRTSSNNIVLSDGDGNPRVVVNGSGHTLMGGATSSLTTLSSSGLEIKSNGQLRVGGSASVDNVILSTGTTGTKYFISHYQNNTFVGALIGSGSGLSLSSASDYRLKENVSAMTGATERLKQLNPSRFNFIAGADTTIDGFLAHEVQAVVPEAVVGTKDAVDDEGNPVYQSIDQSKLVPLLVKTIQELEARITALEGA